MRRGILLRTLVASGVLTLLVSAAFAVLFFSIESMRESANLSRHSEAVLSTANRLERLVVDLETGERGYLLTGDNRLLEPWENARSAIPGVSDDLQRLTEVPAQRQRSRAIDAAIEAYIQDHSAPLVAAERRDRGTPPKTAMVIEGKRLIDGIRGRFDVLVAAERRLAATRQDRSVASARRAAIAAGAGLGGSILFVLAFAGYLARTILRPVRRAAGMADRLARGDLAVRMPETGPGEIGELERSLNTMAFSLEQSRDELQLLAEEQAALRRVATLVAHRASPEDVLDAVADEVGGLLGAPSTRLLRYEPGGRAIVVAERSDPRVAIPVGATLDIGGDNVAQMVLRDGRATRMESFDGATGAIAALLRELGISCAVGAPISVEGRLWGVMVAAWTEQQPLAHTEKRMAQFTELVALAIADAESRAELAASRARVVAAADETRRRIERDLHDGTQQRLIALSLALRAAESSVPADLDDLRDQLALTAKGLATVVEELQEISRGIHPAILSRGGLQPALRNLARRSGVPVELDLKTERRLPERLEVAAYYVASEALTNVAKHARASLVEIGLDAVDGTLRLSIHDDGVGGAHPGGGSGLVGLRDRVEALGGKLDVESPVGRGTSLLISVPIDAG